MTGDPAENAQKVPAVVPLNRNAGDAALARRVRVYMCATSDGLGKRHGRQRCWLARRCVVTEAADEGGRRPGGRPGDRSGSVSDVKRRRPACTRRRVRVARYDRLRPGLSH